MDKDSKQTVGGNLESNIEFVVYRLNEITSKMDTTITKLDRMATNYDRRLTEIEIWKQYIDKKLDGYDKDSQNNEKTTKNTKDDESGVDWPKILLAVLGVLSTAMVIIGTLVSAKGS